MDAYLSPEALIMFAAGVSVGYLLLNKNSNNKNKGIVDYSPNGEIAKRIASVTPYFPFKGIPRFYDIGGFLKDPEAFQLAIDVFVPIALRDCACMFYWHQSKLLLH